VASLGSQGPRADRERIRYYVILGFSMRQRDPLTRLERSRQMGLVKCKDTRPEIAVRKMLWALGYRYRLHPNDVPGRPDIVFKALRKAIFVHGCFWHRHAGCLRTRTPKTRVRFWSKKFEENVARDKSTRARLARSGWRVLVIWECMSEKSTWLQAKLTSFLGERS
jgi:DNA mismatch endonuclease (patch repair protein)